MFNRLQHKKGSASLYLMLLFAAAVAMIGLRQCSARTIPARGEHFATGDTINVAIEISPMGVTTTADSLGGYYYDMLREMAARHNRPVYFHPFTRLSDALDGLKEGRYQLVVSDIPATAELKEDFIFVHPGDIDRQILVQRKDSTGAVPYLNQFNLGGREVVVPKNSPFISRLKNLARETGDTIIITEDPVYSTEQLIIMTSLGEIPNVVASARVAAPLLARYPNLDGSLEISFNQFQGWALSPSDSILRDTINSWLRTEQLKE